MLTSARPQDPAKRGGRLGPARGGESVEPSPRRCGLLYRPPAALVSAVLACDWAADIAADGEVEPASAAFTLV